MTNLKIPHNSESCFFHNYVSRLNQLSVEKNKIINLSDMSEDSARTERESTNAWYLLQNMHSSQAESRPQVLGEKLYPMIAQRI